MLTQPSLDRFSQPGPYEKRYGVKVLLFPHECDVCGEQVGHQFLRVWNGQTVCKYCIKDINEEAEQHEHHTEY